MFGSLAWQRVRVFTLTVATRKVVLLITMVALGVCQAGPPSATPLITIGQPTFGGEALFSGNLDMKDGCVVAVWLARG